MANAPSYLVLDIETVPDHLLWQAPAGDKPVFPPPYAHQVIVIGCMLLDTDYRLRRLSIWPEEVHSLPKGEIRELELLRNFAHIMEDEAQPTLVSYNGRRFDLPVLGLRSLRCGVPMPWLYREGAKARYSEEGHIDLCDWLAHHGASRASSLDSLARLIGLPGKLGMDGSQVESVYAQGRLEEIRDYCLADVAQTAFLFLRFRLLQGVLDSRHYRSAVESLRETLRDEPRLAKLSEAIDDDRLFSAA